MKTVCALRHVPFEDLGSLGTVVRRRGMEIHYLEAGLTDLSAVDASQPELLVVLGGPIGAYEEDAYPFIVDELRLIEKRLEAGLPIIGICLGAQLMARVLGAHVYPGPAKEIGWKPLHLTQAGLASPLAALHQGGETALLHWHGDTFDLPAGTTLLASTDLFTNQAFSYGKNAVAFQCHPEARRVDLERWYIGHACELAAAGISVKQLREDSRRHGDSLEARGMRCFENWLEQAGVTAGSPEAAQD